MPEAGGNYELTDQEEGCEKLFKALEKLFDKLQKANKPARIHNFLKDITQKLKECKALIKDFEREARADGMPTPELNERRKRLVNEVNRFIAAKKAYGQADGSRGDLFDGSAQKDDGNLDGMDVQQLMTRGRREMQETEETLTRAEKIVNDTLDVGRNTAATLHDQSTKLNNIVDELNDMEFNLKKASKVVGDITKAMLTDKCIGFMLFLIVAAVIVVIVLKIINPNKSKIVAAASAIANSTNLTNIVTNLTNSVTSTVSTAVSGALGNRRFLLVRNGSHTVSISNEGQIESLPRVSSVLSFKVYGNGDFADSFHEDTSDDSNSFLRFKDDDNGWREEDEEEDEEDVEKRGKKERHGKRREDELTRRLRYYASTDKRKVEKGGGSKNKDDAFRMGTKRDDNEGKEVEEEEEGRARQWKFSEETGVLEKKGTSIGGEGIVKEAGKPIRDVEGKNIIHDSLRVVQAMKRWGSGGSKAALPLRDLPSRKENRWPVKEEKTSDKLGEVLPSGVGVMEELHLGRKDGRNSNGNTDGSTGPISKNSDNDNNNQDEKVSSKARNQRTKLSSEEGNSRTNNLDILEAKIRNRRGLVHA